MASPTTVATTTGKRPRGRPRTRWRDYIYGIAWSRPSSEPTKLSDCL